jgi:hypothetical protein
VKSKQDIYAARTKLGELSMTIDPESRLWAVISGMSVALCWVCENPHGSTLERIMSGEPLALRTPEQEKEVARITAEEIRSFRESRGGVK